MHNGDCTDITYDVNGFEKESNVEGRDTYHFVICPYNFLGYGLNDNQKLRPLLSKKYVIDDSTGNPTREKLLERCKAAPDQCTGLLMYDGWEFKDDYPYKL